MSWQTARGYCWQRGLRLLRERPGATTVAISLAAVLLALPGFAFMLAQAFGPNLAQLPVAEVNAFVSPGTNAVEVKALASRIETMDRVVRVRLIGRDAAWADLQRRLHEAATLSDIKPNPLPDVLVAEFAPRTAPALVESTAAAIAKQPRVDSVQADLDWYRRISALFRAATVMLVPATGLLGLLVVASVVGLVRHLAVVESSELRLLQQIGAEGDFIRRPFVYVGAVILGLGGAGAIGLLEAGRSFAAPALQELGRLFGIQIALSVPPWPLLLSFLAACLLLGAGAGNFFAGRQITAAKTYFGYS
jgi:cell division transport system permease protein